MSLMNLSTTFGSYAAGTLANSMSIFEMLILSGGIQILMVIPVMLIDQMQTRRILGNGD